MKTPLPEVVNLLRGAMYPQKLGTATVHHRDEPEQPRGTGTGEPGETERVEVKTPAPGQDGGAGAGRDQDQDGQVEGDKPKRPRGRKPDTDHRKDKTIWTAWKTGRFKTLEELGVAYGMTKIQVRQALDRHRSRK